MTKAHDFDAALQWAQEALPRVKAVLAAEIEAVSVKTASRSEDHHGIDYWARLRDGHEVGIELKRRRVNFGDIYLETVSRVEEGIVGWAVDDHKRSDLLLFLWPDWHLLLGYPQLRATFKRHRARYEKAYGVRRAATKKNGQVLWHTENVPVPIAVLISDMYGRVDWPIGTPLTPPRECPGCHHMHPVGTTCLQCPYCQAERALEGAA